MITIIKISNTSTITTITTTSTTSGLRLVIIISQCLICSLFGDFTCRMMMIVMYDDSDNNNDNSDVNEDNSDV